MSLLYHTFVNKSRRGVVANRVSVVVKRVSLLARAERQPGSGVQVCIPHTAPRVPHRNPPKRKTEIYDYAYSIWGVAGVFARRDSEMSVLAQANERQPGSGVQVCILHTAPKVQPRIHFEMRGSCSCALCVNCACMGVCHTKHFGHRGKQFTGLFAFHFRSTPRNIVSVYQKKQKHEPQGFVFCFFGGDAGS